MHFGVVTLFPELVEQIGCFGVVGRAVERGLLRLDTTDPRAFATDMHRTVDDRPYGGGPGMVMKVEPLRSAIRAARERLPHGTRTVFLSPHGRVFDQAVAAEYRELPGLLLVAGRYEGMDERVFRMEADEALTVGDYVLSGGELPAMLVIDAVARLVPRVLLSGDHEAIRRWRLKAALGKTWTVRPGLLADRRLSAEERELLDEYIAARA